MRRRARASIASLVIVTVGIIVGAASLSGQSSGAPRTAWGHPDLQGIWASNSATPLERPKALAGKTLLSPEELVALEKAAAELFDGDTDAAFGDSVFEAALAKQQGFKSGDGGTGNYNHFWLVERTFDRRTSLIIDPPDGRIPPETLEARARRAAVAEQRRLHPADGPQSRGLSERCVTFGVPRFQAAYSSVYQIVQSPEHVVFSMETIHDARVIPLSGRAHLPGSMAQWLGDPRGRWEGDTLIVETRGFSPKSGFLNSTSGLRLVERFTRVAADVLQYDATLNDPATWTAPWTARVLFKRTSDPLLEYACHEGNVGMVGILSGARKQEAEQGSTR
jgi:hypothetical protein